MMIKNLKDTEYNVDNLISQENILIKPLDIFLVKI